MNKYLTTAKIGPAMEIIEPDWKLAFGALAVAVKDAKQSGDFTKCEAIIELAYNSPMMIKTTPKP